MNIKQPVSYDVSHWKEINDFLAIEPKPLFFITKASEAYPASGYVSTDEKFYHFFSEMMKLDCIRGAYHFFRVSLDAKRQAEHFINVISEVDILPSDVLILDMEETGCKASQLWQWFEVVKKAYPDNLMMLYSRKNLLDPIVMTDGEKAYFKKIKIWTAGYPYFPDLFSNVPNGYIPDQSKYGPVWLWQYSSHGKVTGIIGDVDLNWINPECQVYLELAKPKKGILMIINASGKCINANNKVWSSIGGQVIGAFRLNDNVTIDQEQTVSGIRYIHVSNGVLSGWTKAQWFTIIVNPNEPPTEPPPPSVITVPFTITVNGFKPYSGQLEKV